MNNSQLKTSQIPYISPYLQHLKLLRRHDYDTYLHSCRVGFLAESIGKKIELDKTEINQLIITALLHDIGKAKISLEILHKTSTLTDKEWSEITHHPKYGVDIISKNIVAFPQEIIEGIYSHHEHYGGKGYPLRKKGENIPVFSRVIAIADSIDAMTNLRPYRNSPLSLDEALSEIQVHSGSYFDPFIVNRILQRGLI